MALTKAKLEELIEAGDIVIPGGGGAGVPAGGTTGQVLSKVDNTDHNVAWADQTGGGGGGKNLLHNWDFRNPVNQRRVSGTISTGTYFFDRWIRNSGTVTVAAGYLTMASGAVVEQRIEGNLLAGVLCTVSFEVDSTIYTGTGVFPVTNGTVLVEVDGYPDITFGCATGYMFVLVPATSNTSIKRFKCEMGVASTLHLDPPMDHAVELPKCQRFFEVMQSPGFYQSVALNAYYLYSNNVFFSVSKRVVPTVVLISDSGSERGTITERDGSGVFVRNMPAGYLASTQKFSIYTKDADNRFTAGYDYRFRYEASADL